MEALDRGKSNTLSNIWPLRLSRFYNSGILITRLLALNWGLDNKKAINMATVASYLE